MTAPRAAGVLAPDVLLDSLEGAWTHAVALLGAAPPDTLPVAVIVTESWARFSQFLAPSARGLTFAGNERTRAFVVLVHNDSARAYARHEIMHVVSGAVWRLPVAPWVAEGVATWADGRCQGTSVLAVARDLLQQEPGLTLRALPARFAADVGGGLGPRHSVYALAASAVAFVHARGGRAALHALWQTGTVDPGSPPLSDEALTTAWRQYVRRAAAGDPGLARDALVQRGCG